MTRLILGLFKPSRQGGWDGAIRTLLVNAPLRFAPNDNRTSSHASTYRALVGSTRIGDAWEARWGEERRVFYRVNLDDPFLPAPISAALFPDDEALSAQLIWTRASQSAMAASGGAAQDGALYCDANA